MTTTTSRSMALSALLAGALLSASGPAAAQAPPATPAPAAPAAGDTDLKITLKWTTASEVDNYGFFVMRNNTGEEPFEQLNKKAIPGAGNSDTPNQYMFEDHNVELGRTYYYRLDSVSVQGVRDEFSPVVARTCCSVPGQAKPTPAPTPAPKAN